MGSSSCYPNECTLSAVHCLNVVRSSVLRHRHPANAPRGQSKTVTQAGIARLQPCNEAAEIRHRQGCTLWLARSEGAPRADDGDTGSARETRITSTAGFPSPRPSKKEE